MIKYSVALVSLALGIVWAGFVSVALFIRANKALRWIWFASGVLGLSIVLHNCWQHLGNWDALLVTAMAIYFILQWLSDTLAYQWDMPKAEW